jgi:hypothetical protein
MFPMALLPLRVPRLDFLEILALLLATKKPAVGHLPYQGGPQGGFEGISLILERSPGEMTAQLHRMRKHVNYPGRTLRIREETPSFLQEGLRG